MSSRELDPAATERLLERKQAVHRITGAGLMPGAGDIDPAEVELAATLADRQLERSPQEEAGGTGSACRIPTTSAAWT